MKNWADNVFSGLFVGTEEGRLFSEFLNAHDFSKDTRRAFTQDVRKFARWFIQANQERLTFTRVTTRDITDFRDHLRR